MTSPAPGLWYGAGAVLAWVIAFYTSVLESGRPGTFPNAPYVMIFVASALTAASVWALCSWKGSYKALWWSIGLVAFGFVLFGVIEGIATI